MKLFALLVLFAHASTAFMVTSAVRAQPAAALVRAGAPKTALPQHRASVGRQKTPPTTHATPHNTSPTMSPHPRYPTGPSVMIGDPFGFDMVNDPNTQEQVKLTTFTPQITLFMTTMWIVEYCTHHGIPLGTGIWR